MKTARTIYESTLLTIGYSIAVLCGVLLPFILLSSARILPIVILGFIYAEYWRRLQGDTKRPLKKLWIAFWIVTLFVRVDLSFIDLPGSPRLTRYALGLPMRATVEAAQRGEVVLHGCVITGLEPLWIVTW